MVAPLVVAGLALVVGNLVSQRLHLMGPLVLVGLGVVLSFVPHIARIYVAPEVVLSVLLPLSLFWEAHNIPLRGIRRSLRGVLLNGTLMVAFVAVAIGLVGKGVGLTLATALLVGAAVGPTDATAVTALGKGISRGQLVVLRAESLINDGTALVVFAMASEYATGETITAGHAVTSFLVSFAGGVLVGLVVGWLTARLGRHVDDFMAANLLQFVIPLGTYWLAERFEASGVLAVVVTGLFLARFGTRNLTMQARAAGRPVWALFGYVVNSLLFLLVGLYLVDTARSLNSTSLGRALVAVVVLYLTMMLARWVFGEVSIRMIRLLDRRPSQRLRRTTPWERLVMTTSGFRGAISLAVAFSIPESLPGGSPFPYRDLVLFVTSGIVILSLAVQGALLPLAVRQTRKHPNPLAAKADHQDEEVRDAVASAARAVLDAMPGLAKEVGADEQTTDEVREGWERKLRLTTTPADLRAATADSDEAIGVQRALTLRTIQVGREHIIGLRDTDRIDDEALVELMARYDIEEMRVVGPLELE